jgi:CBS domain-containing protein
MRERGVRRLPIVTEDGKLTGIVTADDLTVLLTQELADLGLGIENRVDATESR